VKNSTAVDSPWTLVTVTGPHSPSTQVGIQMVGSSDVRVPDCLRGFTGVLQVIDKWDIMAEQLRAQDPTEGELVDAAQLQMPLAYPRKVMCSGPNFHDHLAEMGESGLGDAWSAYFFFKPPTTSLIGPTDSVLVGPDWEREQVDWEGELAVVMARGGRDIPRTDALTHVGGYLVANDISLRGRHRRDTPAAPFVWDWVASKGADTSLPIGPGVVPAWLVPDPQRLQIRTWVNGELKQDGTTADMVLDVATLIADASALVTLEAGDVILTGTPAGVGASRGMFLVPGDVVDIEIPGIGSLHNPIQQRKVP
jgi:2-keto-4-pentenoate hydratase/2-oxohepta-3-ene-1,7-dioic acid hydratase in catechol pathway